MRRRAGLLLALLCTPLSLVAAQSAARTDLGDLLARVGESVERYLARAQSVVCLETVTLQSLGYDLLADQTPRRRLTYELRVSWAPSGESGLPEATAERRLLTIGSRPPGPKDKPGCMDPKEVSDEPLSILLPVRQSDYVFTLAGATRVGGRAATMIDYRAKAIGPITSRMSDDECWSVELPGRIRGRFWIDQETADVLRLDERLTGVFDVTLPATQKRREVARITIERLDSSTTYQAVTFADPDETLMLPKSVDTVMVVRNSGAPRTRKTQTFSNYRRFLTGGRIVQDD